MINQNLQCVSLTMHITNILCINLNLRQNVTMLLDYVSYKDTQNSHVEEDFSDLLNEFSFNIYIALDEFFSNVNNKRKLFRIQRVIENHIKALIGKVNSICTFCRLGIKTSQKDDMNDFCEIIDSLLTNINEEFQLIKNITKKN